MGTRSAKKRGMPLQHVMFYGPPGTGKTMVAQRFAEYSGLEYAIMCGGDVAPLQEDAVTELHKLFQWVHRSRRGVLLFIDEADSFLASRKGANMSESLRNALTTMLYHTGTPTSQFMLVLATNRPNDLDAAALDRIDESVEFGLPALEARESMVQLYFQKYIAQPLGLSLIDSTPTKPGKEFFCRGRQPKVHQSLDPESLVGTDALKDVARRIQGFSGREISKLFTSLQTHILYSERGHVDSLQYMRRDQLFEVVKQKVVEHGRTHEFQLSGYDYVHNEEPAEATDTDPKIVPEFRCRPKPLNEETVSGVSQQRAPVHHQLSPTAAADTSGNSPLRVFGFASTPTDA